VFARSCHDSGNNEGGAVLSLAELGFVAPSGTRFARHGPGGASDARLCDAKPRPGQTEEQTRIHRQGERSGFDGSEFAIVRRLKGTK
jgi:hypothetical protein